MHCKVAMRRSTALENYEGGEKSLAERKRGRSAFLQVSRAERFFPRIFQEFGAAVNFIFF